MYILQLVMWFSTIDSPSELDEFRENMFSKNLKKWYFGMC